ncbi:MAG: hypothetical protein V1905_01190 [bacterium]
MKNQNNQILAIPSSAMRIYSIGLPVLSFFVPFIIGHPQWLIGTVVNACLFLSAGLLSKKSTTAVIILPSLGVLARGIIFGPMTISLIYFLPFIWAGNYLMVIVFRWAVQRISPLFGVILSAITKFAVLFFPAVLYVRLSLVSSLFLQLMGINQLLTALGGGIIALAFIDILKNRDCAENK